MLDLQAMRLNKLPYVLAVVATPMPGPGVTFAPAVAMRRYRKNEFPAGCQPSLPLIDSGMVVLNVLKHIEGADQVEATIPVRLWSRVDGVRVRARSGDPPGHNARFIGGFQALDGKPDAIQVVEQCAGTATDLQ
ncbi:MAG: hypothetical protein ABS96_24925 [Lysobacteraceae bacterium SCN 69-123]|nr:MAG: hypothetical protein ABS96_24925 [Xanthomonadaceae bacterium SCN 69-123]